MEERLLKAKKFTDEMLDYVKGRGRIIIIVHDNPDPDSLASAMAMRHLFMQKLGEVPVIAFSGMIGRSENLVMAKVLDIPLTPLGILDLADFSVVCMLDTQPGTGNNSLPEDVPVDIVIDHHPLREATKSCCFVDVRDDYGVTATVLYEYLLAQEVNIGPKLATAIFYAIKSDTQDLGREANRPDRDAYLKLFPLSNKKLLYQITNPRQPMEYFRTIRRTLDRARIYGNVIIVNMGEAAFPELIAEMADFLLRLDEIEAVLSMGQYGNEMILSLRTIHQEMNAGEVTKRLVKGLGLAGGHGMTAGGKIEKIPQTEGAMLEVERILTERFLEETGYSGSGWRAIDR